MLGELIRATAHDGKIRVFAVHLTAVVEEMRRRHNTSPTATAALGRTVAASVMMGAMMKGNERLTVQVRGNGPIGQIVVDTNADLEVRGYVDHPEVDLPLNHLGKLDVKGIVGSEGFIYILKDLGMKEPYRGSTPIVSGELGEDFTYYFAKSEQTPSAVALGVLVDTDYSVKAAGGLILQLLPGLSNEEITEIEREINNLPPITSLLDQGLTLDEIVNRLISPVSVMERKIVRFQCKCSKDKVEATLISLGKLELDAFVKEKQENVEIICHFCNERYLFTKGDVMDILTKL